MFGTLDNTYFILEVSLGLVRYKKSAPRATWRVIYDEKTAGRAFRPDDYQKLLALFMAEDFDKEENLAAALREVIFSHA